MLDINKILLILRGSFVGVATVVALTACDNNSFTNEAGELPDVGVIDQAFGTLRSRQSIANHLLIGLTEGNGVSHDDIYYSLSQPASQPTSLTVVVDPALIPTYNATYGTDFDMLPPSNVSIAHDGILSIESGESVSEALEIEFKATGLAPGTYLLPISVASQTNLPQPERQQLFYGVKVRGQDRIDNPLDTDFLTVFYLNTDEYQPLLADIFAVEKTDMNTFKTLWKRTIGNIVNLRVVQIGYDKATDGAQLLLNANIRYVMEHADKYLRPLQDKGRKVCLSIEGAGTGLGFCNLTDMQIADFVAQVENVVETYRLDGINLWDRNSGYGKEGMPPMNTTSYPRLIKALREALGKDKLLTVTDYKEPTEYFWDTSATDGIAVGDYIDYAWSGYMSEEEDVQLLDPWLDANEAMGKGITLLARKPFAGLDPSHYGNFAVPWYASDNEFYINTVGYFNVIMWRTAGYMKSPVVVYADLISRLQNNYEMTLANVVSMVYICIEEDSMNMETGETMNDYSFKATNGPVGRGDPNGWPYNYLTKDW